MPADKGKPYVATGGNVPASRLPRFADPRISLLTGQRAEAKVKPPIFRGNSAHRTLRGRALQDKREEMFAKDPLCAECRRQGRVREWNELDHIVPLAEGGTDADKNLQGLCYECHEIKTALEIKRLSQSPNSFRKPPGGE